MANIEHQGGILKLLSEPRIAFRQLQVLAEHLKELGCLLTHTRQLPKGHTNSPLVQLDANA